MIDRFTGKEGKRLLLDAMQAQELAAGEPDAGRELGEVAQLVQCRRGEVLIEQNSADNDIYFILAGGFTIIVNGRPVAERFARQHIGEMAVVDPKARRSATAIAVEESVVARVSEPDFAAIACAHPALWRRMACELGERLRQRNALVRARNAVPRLFIGSSVEHLDVARAIGRLIPGDRCEVTVWTEGVFGPSEYTMASLEDEAAHSDFAVLVLGADDEITSRDEHHMAPRDNVVLELGLFIGALGRARTFIAVERGRDIKIPTDLLGITPLKYSAGDQDSLDERLAPTCTDLAETIAIGGPK